MTRNWASSQRRKHRHWKVKKVIINARSNGTTDIHAYIKVARPYSPKTQMRTMIDKDAELTAPVLRMNFHRGIIVQAICTVDDMK